jgi:GH25 family lysozyme M1 (1,4-beta-N-acetylmuramidase)
MTITQARVVDVHRYYRSGGIDWDKIKLNFDAVIISAGVGMSASPLLKEQVDGANDIGIPYMTYHIPSKNYNMIYQADYYLDQYGVRDAWTCIDIEPPVSDGSIRCINATESLAYIQQIKTQTGRDPLVYSNPKYINEAIHNPVWLKNYWLWIAQWLYQYWWLLRLYRQFEPFLAKYANTFPPFVRNKYYQVKTILWQFTCKGDAQTLCASAKTLDPVYKYGITEADLNVSTIERSAFLAMLGATPSPVPPPSTGDWYQVNVAERNIRNEPNSVTGIILVTLHLGDRVEVSSLAPGSPGIWGAVIAYKHNEFVSLVNGFVYMTNLIKV